MKKILLLVLLTSVVSLGTQAQRKFYYYPQSNVYFDPSASRFIYLNGNNWTPVATLPSNIVAGTRRYIVYNQTPEVWTQNAEHVKKYKAPKMKKVPNGKAVGYWGGNENDGKGKGHGHGNGHGRGHGKH